MIEKLQEIKKMDLNCGVFSVYDMDGKTTQEIFNQFFTKINDVIDATNASVTLIEYLVDAGLQEEIAQKLIEWVEDGTLKGIIDEDVLEEIHAKVDGAIKEVEEQKDRVENMMFQLQDNFEFLKDKESFNVKFYGARGNGVDDDTDALKKALFACGYSSDCKTVFIPAGIYLINDTLDIPEGTTIIGEGNSVIKYNANNISVNITGSNITIKDVVFDGNADEDITTSNVISTTGAISRNVTIKDVVFENYSGTILNIINAKSVQGFNVKDCVFDKIKARELKYINVCGGSKQIFIKNNDFKMLTASIDDEIHCVYLDRPKVKMDAYIQNNYFNVNATEYIHINTDNVTVTNNHFDRIGAGEKNVCVQIENSSNIQIKNNSYKLNATVMMLYPAIKADAGSQIFVSNENIIIDGTPSSFSVLKPIFEISNADITIDNISCTGKYVGDTFISATDCKSVVFKNSTIDGDSEIKNIIKLMNKSTTTRLVRIDNNNINIKKGQMLITTGDATKNVLSFDIKNNKLTYMFKVDTSKHDCITLKNFDGAEIENNKIKGNVNVYDFNTLTLQNNVIGKLYVSSDQYDIISQNNVFDGASNECYKLSCNSQNKCRLLSKNNYNKNNLRLIHFYCDKVGFLNADNMDIMTMNDINSNDVQKQRNIFIVKDDNVTADVYKSCFVQTSQELPGFTWHHTYEQPLFDYRKPNGTIIYNAITGKSTIYVEHRGVNKTTSL